MARSSRHLLVTTALAGVLFLHGFEASPSFAAAFSNREGITVRDNAIAQPYPSTIAVAALAGTVTKVSVTLTGITHACPIDLDVQLVSPAGTSVLLMSDAGAPPGGGCPRAKGVDLTFDSAAPSRLPDRRLESGVYRPADYGEDDPSHCGSEEGGPAPDLIGAARLDTMEGEDPNGEWRLHVVDDCSDDTGSIAGWDLELGTTASPFVDVRPPVVTDFSVVPRCMEAVRLVKSAGEHPLSARYRLSEDSSVTYAISRRLRSHARRHCPGPPRPGLPGRYRDVASLKEPTRAGRVRQTLGDGERMAMVTRAGKNPGTARSASKGRRGGTRAMTQLVQGRRLRPGTYLVQLLAHDAAGNRSAVSRAKFWVLAGG